MEGSSSSSSSTSSNARVYLSFCGEDSGDVFTTHLKHVLSKKGIDSFTYEDKALIDESRGSIIIFSPNYASSTSRLDEVVKILDCKEAKGLFLLPVFYGVAPTDVRYQTGNFGEAFDKHVEDFRAQRWRDALGKVANLAGMDLQNNRDEADFIRKIVEEVSSKLGSNSSSVASSNIPEGFSGINSRVALARVKSYLSWWLAGIRNMLFTFFFFFPTFLSTYDIFMSCLMMFDVKSLFPIATTNEATRKRLKGPISGINRRISM